MKHCDSSRRSLLSLPVLALAVAGARAVRSPGPCVRRPFRSFPEEHRP